MNYKIECPVVVDIGSYQTRAGFASENLPKHVFRSKLYRDSNKNNIHYIGNLSPRNSYPLKFPFERRSFSTNLDKIALVFKYIYENLKVSFEDHPIFLTESYSNLDENRNKIIEILIENFNVPCLNFGLQSVLSLYANGIMTGAVLDSGDGFTETACISNGYLINDSLLESNISGSVLSNYLIDMMNLKSNEFHNSFEKEIIRDIKEKVCYISHNYDFESKKFESQDLSLGNFYELPDGRTVTPGIERINCGEILFQPNIAGFIDDGVHILLNKSINSVDKIFKSFVYSNILLTGGNTRFNNFSERLKVELNNLSNESVFINETRIQNSQHSAWIGASIISSLSFFNTMWITKQEYQEYGSNILKIKNFFF